MKKINRSGFVLAETLVVTVFLMVLFAMIYSNYYPLIGEYEKREVYDDVDGKYAVYWLKRMIEDTSYSIPSTGDRKNNFTKYGYVRFECSDVAADDEKRNTCKNLVKALQVEGCNKNGDDCEIYITKYRIGNSSDTTGVWFKNTAKNNLKNYEENCFSGNCRQKYITNCQAEITSSSTTVDCSQKADKKVFRSGFKDYIVALPDYSAESLNYAKYRVIASFHHTKDNNNYYSYATIEVSR